MDPFSMASLFRTTKGNEYSSPRTVLGFYAGLLVILEVGVAVVLGFLVSQEDLHYLVPWVIGFGALLFIGVVIVVVCINIIDPTKLQLGRITGREFMDYQRVTRGDSIGGDYIEAPADASSTPATQFLPPAEDKPEEADSTSDILPGPSHGQEEQTDA